MLTNLFIVWNICRPVSTGSWNSEFCNSLTMFNITREFTLTGPQWWVLSNLSSCIYTGPGAFPPPWKNCGHGQLHSCFLNCKFCHVYNNIRKKQNKPHSTYSCYKSLYFSTMTFIHFAINILLTKHVKNPVRN
jgi:hypothetical protein